MIFAIALWVRLDFVAEHPPRLYVFDDMAFYDASARRLLEGTQTAWDSFTPVGYPALLALVYRLSRLNGVDSVGVDSVGVIQAVLGALTCVLAAALARRLSQSAVAAFVVGLAIAFYSPLLLYTGLLMSETVFACALVGFVWLLIGAVDRHSRSWAMGAGLLLGVAIAIRPNLVLAVPMLAAAAVLLRRRRGVARVAVFAFVTACLPMGIASVHQSRLVGRPAALATNGGVNFFLGHCECRAVRFNPGNRIVQVAGHHNRARYAEMALDEGPAYDEVRFYRRTLELIENDPARLVRDLSNVVDGLGLGDLGPPPAQPYWPGWMGHDAELRDFGRAFLWLALGPAAASALALLLRGRFVAGQTGLLRLILWLLFASVIATHYLFLGDPRIRVSFDPLVVVLASEAWSTIIRPLRAFVLAA